MSKTNGDADILAHLQFLDQCGYDLLEVIKAHFTEPVDVDKELEEYFWKILIELENLVRKTPSIIVELNTIPSLPNKHLFSNDSDDPKKDLRDATTPLKLFLSDVRSMRRAFGVPAHTEIRDERLREYLAGVYQRKGVPSKLFTKPSVPPKIAIIFDTKRGFYKSGDSALSYSIGKNSKRLKLIKYLCPFVHGKSVAETRRGAGYRDENLVIKELNNVNRLFRDKLKVAEDLIVHNETGGYLLNHAKFSIQNLC